MAITLNKLVYDILNTPNGGEVSDDLKVPKRQVLYWINMYRALLATQEMSKKNKIAPELIQTIRCIDLIKVDVDSCCEDVADGSCYMLRSELKMPVTLSRGGKDTIISVESVDGLKSFSRSKFWRRKTRKYNKWTSTMEGWYIENDYLYIITNNPVMNKVRVSGVFANPEELEQFKCADAPCFTWDDAYPISMDMIPIITKLIFEEKMRITLSTKPDNINDANAN